MATLAEMGLLYVLDSVSPFIMPDTKLPFFSLSLPLCFPFRIQILIWQKHTSPEIGQEEIIFHAAREPRHELLTSYLLTWGFQAFIPCLCLHGIPGSSLRFSASGNEPAASLVSKAKHVFSQCSFDSISLFALFVRHSIGGGAAVVSLVMFPCHPLRK